MIGVEDEDAPHRILDHRIDLIGLGRDAEGHAQEIAGVGQRLFCGYMNGWPIEYL